MERGGRIRMLAALGTVTAAVLGASTLTSTVAAAAPTGPGAGALYARGDSKVLSVSCTAAGNCAAAGSFTDRARHGQAFVVSERHGIWGRAEEVPGLAALNVGGSAGIHQVSCSSAGNCSAGGWYKDAAGQVQAFVSTEVRGTWRAAIPVPGILALNTGGYAVVQTLSCASAGNCLAAGTYSAMIGGVPAGLPFVADQVRGAWRPAHELQGALIAGAVGAQITSASCATPGNCAVGGSYTDDPGGNQAFVADEVGHSWQPAMEVPGTARLNLGNAQTTAVSCPSAGQCAAVGYFASRKSGYSQAFVVSQRNGTWGQARPVMPAGHHPAFQRSQLNSVSCGSAGNCSAGGTAFGGAIVGRFNALVVGETRGTWSAGRQLPASRALGKVVGAAQILALSCAAPGYCAAGGQYMNGSGDLSAFVAKERAGRWQPAIEVPGIAALNTGGIAQVTAVSCGAVGHCRAGGFYSTKGLAHERTFLVWQVRASWGRLIGVPGL
ncbi:MAG: hypothetical protein ACYCVZ_05965 [Streptosporangiaceae bacterium]